MRKFTNLKKVIAVVLAILVVSSTFALFGVSAANTNTTTTSAYVGGTATADQMQPVGAESTVNTVGATQYTAHSSNVDGVRWTKRLVYTDVLNGSSQTIWENQGFPYHYVTKNGSTQQIPAYCIDPQGYLNYLSANGGYFSVDDLKTGNKQWNSINNHPSVKKALATVMAFGYPNSSHKGREFYYATQLMLWEVLCSVRDKSTLKVSNGKQLYNYISASDSFKKKIIDAYEVIDENITTIYSLPKSFNTKKEDPKKATYKAVIEYKDKIQKFTGHYEYKNKDISWIKSHDYSLKIVNQNDNTPDSKFGLEITAQNNKKISIQANEKFKNATNSFYVKLTKKLDCAGYETDKVLNQSSDKSQTIAVRMAFDKPVVVGYLPIVKKIVELQGDLQITKEIENTDGTDYTGDEYEGWYFLVSNLKSLPKTEYLLKTNEDGITPKLSEVANKEIAVGEKPSVRELGRKLPKGYNADEYYHVTSYNGADYGFKIDDWYINNNDTSSYPRNNIKSTTIENDVISQITFVNKHIPKYPITIKKTSADDKVSGFYFFVYDVNSQNKIIKSQIAGPTDENGEVTIYSNVAKSSVLAVKELGYLKFGETFDKYDTSQDTFNKFELPNHYDVKTGNFNVTGMDDAVPYTVFTKNEIAKGSVNIPFENTCSGYVKIVKTDTVLNEPVANAVYGIYDKNITDDNGYLLEENRVDELYTDESGIAQSKKLSCGKYYIQEISAPNGYVLNKDVIEVDVTIGENTKENPNVITKEVKDKPTYLKISKLIASNLDSNGKLLAGATLQVVDENNEVVDGLSNIVTNSESPIEIIGKLTVGKTYTVKEIVTPKGYATAEPVEITISTDGTVDEISLTDETTKVELSKKTLTGEDELAGATLKVTDEQGNIVKDNQDKDLTWVSANEPYLIENVFEVGKTYYLEEVTAPNGYATAERVAFTVLDTGEIQKVVMRDDTIKVEISKTTITGEKEIAGATLSVKEKDTNTEIETWVSTDKPHLIEGKLITGKTYILTEVIPADGYATANDVEFTVSDTGEIQKVVMRDDTIKVQFSKTTLTGDKEIEGASLTLKEKDTDTEIESWVSSSEPHMIEGQLVAGKTYILTETLAPKGYVLANAIEFTVLDTGEIQQVTMVDDTTKVEIKKICADTQKGLAGAELEIYDSEDNLVKEFTSTENALLVEGEFVSGAEYRLHEAKAPDGYEVAEDVFFTAPENGEVLTVTMEDKKIVIDPTTEPTTEPTTDEPTPVTGGTETTISIFFSIGFILILSAIFILCFVSNKKSRQRK